jgi:hypothetical protein
MTPPQQACTTAVWLTQLHHPAAWQHREGGTRRRFDIASDQHPARGWLHDLQGPAARLGHPGAESLAAIRHIGPDMLQPLDGGVCRGEQPRRHVGIPHIGGMDEDTPQETRRLNEEMALAAVEFLGAIIAMYPPFSVVFTVCASMMAAEGCGWRPMRVRTASRS